MLDGDSKLAKYFYVLPKLVFVIYLLLAVPKGASDLLLTISSPLLFAAANAIFAFTKNSRAKDRVLLIAVALIYAVIIILFLLVTRYIIYANFAVIIVEIVLIAKLNLNSKQHITKAVILSIPIQLVLMATSFSMYHNFMKSWLFIIFVVLMSLFALLLSGTATKLIYKEHAHYASRHMAKKLIATILAMAWTVPFMYCSVFGDGNFVMRLDFMIYGLVLAIYPYSSMLLVIVKQSYYKDGK